MTTYVARRAAFFLIGLFAASIVIFALIRLAGGDVATVMLGQNATPQAAAELRHTYGLDRALPTQYLSWIGDLLQGNLGRTFVTHESVGSRLLSTLPISLPLVAGGLAVAVLIAVPLGTYSARYAHTRVGTLLALVGQVGVAIPVFWAGVLLSLFFGVRLGWLPTGGWVPWSTDPAGAIKSLVLPCVGLGVIEAAGLSRYVRSTVLDILNEDYVRTARATGMSRSGALLRVGLRNAAPPVITVVGLQASSLIGGAIIIEQVFSLPGLSNMLLSAVSAREVIAVQSIVMVIVLFVMAVNLGVDLLHGVLDPRVRVAR